MTRGAKRTLTRGTSNWNPYVNRWVQKVTHFDSRGISLYSRAVSPRRGEGTSRGILITHVDGAHAAPKPKNPPVPPAIGGGSGGDDLRGVWGTTRELHLKVTAHRKAMREVRDSRLYRDFQAFSRRRDEDRARAQASTVAHPGAPVDDSHAVPMSASSRPPRDDGEDPLLLLIRTVDEAARTLGVERRGVWSEVGKPYRAGGGAPVAHVPRDVRELLPSRVAQADPAALQADPAAEGRRPPTEIARARDPDDASDEPLDEMLADVGYGRGIFAPTNISDDEVTMIHDDRDADEEADEEADARDPSRRASDAASARGRLRDRSDPSTLRAFGSRANFYTPWTRVAARCGVDREAAEDSRRRRVDRRRRRSSRRRRVDRRRASLLAAETSRSSTASLLAAETSRSSTASLLAAETSRKKGAKDVEKSDGWREAFVAVRERKNEHLREMLRGRTTKTRA